MADVIRVRVAEFRDSDFSSTTYLADREIEVEGWERLSSLVEDLLEEVDPDGFHYPAAHGRRGPVVVRAREVNTPVGDGRAGYKWLQTAWWIDDRDRLGRWTILRREDLPIGYAIRATEAGYNELDLRDLVIRRSEGFGGDYAVFDFATFFGSIGLNLASGMAADLLWRIGQLVGLNIRTKNADKQMATIAKRWEVRGIESPYMLRQWIEVKDSWDILEVSTRLQLESGPAYRLLSQLGYEPLKGNREIFVRSESRRARGNLKRWKKHETESGMLDAW